MFEWIESFLTALGGGTVVLLGVLTIFKKMFIRMFETGIESSFEKNIVKFKNKLDRSTRAYEILLDREMRFYEKLEPITSELIPLVHDLNYFLNQHEGINHKVTCEKFSEHFNRYGDLIIILKNETLVHQLYIPQEIFTAFTSVVKQMQDNLPWWTEMGKLLFDENYEQIDYAKCEETVSTLLAKLAFAEVMIRKRLNQLAESE